MKTWHERKKILLKQLFILEEAQWQKVRRRMPILIEINNQQT